MARPEVVNAAGRAFYVADRWLIVAPRVEQTGPKMEGPEFTPGPGQIARLCELSLQLFRWDAS